MRIITNNTTVVQDCDNTRIEFDNFYKGNVLVCEKGNSVVERFLVEGFPNLQDIEVESLPEDFKPNKYCYTEEKGFYLNPDWHEPNKYGVPDETVAEIIADNTKLLESIGVLGGAK